MERWTNRVALVTGASAGIGFAICKTLVQSGMTVVGAARNVEKINALASDLKNEPGSLMAIKCDLTKDDEVYAVFDAVKKSFGGVDVCINNAGMSFNKSLLDGTPDQWRYMMDINVIALCLCTKLAVESMKERGLDDGHIINISSMAGHKVFSVMPSIHFYCGTKHAVRAISEGLRQELRQQKSHIRVSVVSPGGVTTSFLESMFGDEETILDFPTHNVLKADDVAIIIRDIISKPDYVQVNDIIVQPIGQE